MEEDLEFFIFNLLCKRKRRILILTKWHTTFEPEKDIASTFHKFFKIILYSPIKLTMYQDYFKLFDNTQDLQIPYKWLLPQEQDFIIKLFKEREQVFGKIEFYVSGTFSLRNCKIQGDNLWSIEHRREILRDFVFLVIKKKDFQHAHYFLLNMCQKFLADEKIKPDRFIVELHNVLQNRDKFENLKCIYP